MSELSENSVPPKELSFPLQLVGNNTITDSFNRYGLDLEVEVSFTVKNRNIASASSVSDMLEAYKDFIFCYIHRDIGAHYEDDRLQLYLNANLATINVGVIQILNGNNYGIHIIKINKL